MSAKSNSLMSRSQEDQEQRPEVIMLEGDARENDHVQLLPYKE